MTRVCDYEGSTYRTDFWESQTRAYEDKVERIALRHLLPLQGKTIIEIGAGFGRLANMYAGYQQVIIQDYARSQLEEAQRYLGRNERYIFVVANVYDLPFVDNLFDTLTMVRVMHHLADVPAALTELHRIIRSQGIAVIEYASKFNLKAISRWLLRRQDWSPFDPTPHEFVEMNFNFHPAWMRQQFEQSGFVIEATRTVSHYRLPLLKKIFPASLLARLDGWAQPTGRWWQLTPSIFLRVRAHKAAHGPPPNGFFRCPECQCSELNLTPDMFICQDCQRRWSTRDGIYDFKTPLP